MDALIILTLVAGSAALPQGSPAPAGCCFHLTASGGPGGDVGQLYDGQNRIGQTNLQVPKGQYCLDSQGGLTDSVGRGCILTPPTTQWQCDTGAAPTPQFSVGCDGKLLYQGKPDFWSCPTEDNGGYNIYTQPLSGEPDCVPITLSADNKDCSSGCAAPPPPPAQPACPGNLPSQFEYPHLIIPVDSSKPNQASPNSFNGTACAGVSSIFNFDIPFTADKKSCSASFLLPKQAQLETSAFELSGSGAVQFAQLDAPATEGMTSAGAPKVKQDYGSFTLAPGNAYNVASFPCPAGSKIGIQLSAKGDTCLNYFQDYNPCPIGLYITTS